MNSVISFPERGKWGKSDWRGNCSGHIQRELIEHFNPRLFVDVCEGSGTSRDVCKDLGVEYRGFDLHTGTDFTSDFILSKLDRPADMVFSHPPYGAMIDYTKIGTFANPGLKARDTSSCESIDDFLERSRVMLLNQREAVREGGHYVTLIGDLRSKGVFRSFQSDFINMMPTAELASVVIKMQHNCISNNRKYTGNFVPIVHEYMLIWKRSTRTLVQVAIEGLMGLKRQAASTWRTLVQVALMKLGGKATLSDIYEIVKQQAGAKILNNANWMAKIRQTLQYHFTSVQRGLWAISETGAA